MWGALRNAAAIASEQAQNLTTKGIASATQLLEKLDGQLEEGEEEEGQQDNSEENFTDEPVNTESEGNVADVEPDAATTEQPNEANDSEKKQPTTRSFLDREIFSINNVLADLQENFVKPLAAEVFDQGNTGGEEEQTYEELRNEFNDALEHITKLEAQVESLKVENERLTQTSSLANEVEVLREENRRLSAQAKDSQVAGANAGVIEAENAELIALRSKNAELVKELESLREKYDADVGQLTAANSATTTEKETLSTEVEHLKELVDKHRKKKTAMSAEITTLKRDLEKEKADAEDIIRTFRDREQDFINSIAKLRD